MIDMDRITKDYGSGAGTTRVLKGISLSIRNGEYAAIMGTSGTGKSTLMNILGCLDQPTGGSYRLEGTEVGSLDDEGLSHLRNRRIGFVFQQFHLLERTSALQNVMLPLLYAETYPADAEERARKALTAVGLADRLSYKPGELSGGQQQRVAIARALVTKPALLLADEPTGNLDAKNGAEILALFQELHRQGHTLVLVTHDPAVAGHTDRVLVLQDGIVAEDRKILAPRTDPPSGGDAAGVRP